ncbi:hypothetical protein [Streptomyces sp. NPDC051109]|uniref:hypothetical protein n=1 Tax=Streptomyces sp. NPDC051109 TaxID=3365642 RepID=UPI0037897941
MRLRPTAVALLGALTLVLPTAGPSLAGGHDDLGRLQYIIDNDERAQIRPSDNDTCYELTGTSRNRPATAVHNDTESRALLYPNHACGGRVERELQPGDTVYNVEVLSVSFVPTHGRRDDWGDNRRDDLGDNRRDDWRDDEDDFRSHRTPMDQPGQEQGKQEEHGQDEGKEQGKQEEHGQDEGKEQGKQQEHGQDEGKEQGKQEEHGQDEGKEHGRHQEHHKGGHDLFDFIFRGRG